MGKKAPAALERQHLLLNHRIHFLLCYDILISLGFATKTLQLCRNQDKSDSQQNQRRVFVRPFLRYRAALQQMTTGNWTHFSNCRVCRIHQSKKKKEKNCVLPVKTTQVVGSCRAPELIRHCFYRWTWRGINRDCFGGFFPIVAESLVKRCNRTWVPAGFIWSKPK